MMNYETEDVDILLVSFGCMVRSCKDAVRSIKTRKYKSWII